MNSDKTHFSCYYDVYNKYCLLKKNNYLTISESLLARNIKILKRELILISKSLDDRIQIFNNKKCKLHKIKFQHEVNEANELTNRFMRSPAMPPLNNRKLNRITIRNIIFFNELIILFAYSRERGKKYYDYLRGENFH